jgi:hypothetical protein
MIEIAIVVGALVSYVEPRTGTPLCGKVAHVGEGVAGEPTVWVVQVGGSRAIKAPLAEVTRGCGEDKPPAATPAPAPPGKGVPALSTRVQVP